MRHPPSYNAAMATGIPSPGLPFRKMHGLGNDFVVLDARRNPITLTAASAAAIADRRRGIGCDQIMMIEPPRNRAHAALAIRNSGGGVVESCGNGSRCVARVLMDETGKDSITLETLGGVITAT